MTRKPALSNETIELSRLIRRAAFGVCPKSNRVHVRDENEFRARAHAPVWQKKKSPAAPGF
ncbi:MULTISPECIES: hypothetical protein [unclassified Bradyrhizobium]|uniref:hypothetical protein n=1 Tax=unclassified Bradyrhizobium TaxID=2631580 RepID=UPI002FEFD8E7